MCPHAKHKLGVRQTSPRIAAVVDHNTSSGSSAGGGVPLTSKYCYSSNLHARGVACKQMQHGLMKITT